MNTATMMKTEKNLAPVAAANDEHAHAEIGTTQTLALLDTSATTRTLRRRFSASRVQATDNSFRLFRVF